MSAAEQERWHRTSPLAAIFYLGKMYQAIAQHAIQTFAPLAALLFASEGNLISKLVFGVVAFVIVTVTTAFVQYWFFRYSITGNSVLIRDGVFKKTQLDIKFDRIQAISTQQNILFRSFGLVTIKLDTAGSAKQEGHLPAVSSNLSDELKERIRQKFPAKNAAEDGMPDSDIEGSKVRKLLQLDARDMLRIGLSSNRALIFLVLLSPILGRFEDKYGDSIDKESILAATQNAETSIAAGAGLGVMVVIGILLFLIIASIVGAFLSYHRFKLVSDNDVLRSTAGLLTRHEHSVNLAKIQSLVATQNIMQRLFKRFRLQAKQASSGKPGSTKNFIIPLCEPDWLPELHHEVFRKEFPGAVLDPTSTAFQPIAKQFIRSRFLLTGVLPATAVTTLMALLIGPAAMFFLLWLPISAFGVWRRYKRYGVLVTTDGIAMRRGFVGYRVTAFLHRKVQRISVTQTFLQRRKGLATLRVYLASGSVKIPYVDFRQASELRDHVLYRIESSQLSWH